MVFLSNYLVFKIVLAALGRTDYPVAGDLELKYDNANKVYLSGGSLDYIDDFTLWTTIGGETRTYDSVESLNLDISNEKILLADDRDTNTQLGYGCAIDGDYIIGGAPQDDEGGSQAGAAYIFKRNGTSWKQTAKLIVSDAASNDQAAEYVNISGDYAIIGVYTKSSNRGAIYIFKRDTGAETWTEQEKITASDGASNHYFGWGVSISSDYAISGARVNNKAYIFKRSGTSWSEEAVLTGTGIGSGDNFGSSVVIKGDYAIVGAINGDSSVTGSGAVYVYKRSGTSWTQQTKLVASDPVQYDAFGISVDIDGDYIAVGAAQVHTSSLADVGAIYIFKKDADAETWSQQAKLMASDPGADDYLTNWGSLSISGDTVVAGANYHDTDVTSAGAAYVWKRSGTTWTEVKKLIAGNHITTDGRFGISVGVSGNTILVGAAYNDVGGVTHAGALYVYDPQLIKNYYINEVGKYSVDATIAGLKYKTNEVDVTSLNIPAKVVSVSAGYRTSAAITEDGSVYAWGNDGWGSLGQGTTNAHVNTPIQVKGVDGVGFLSNIKQVSVGGTQVLALANDGTLYAWGYNNEGQLGVGDNTSRYYPTVVPYSGEAISKIHAGHKHSLFCTVTNGYVYACGENQSGQVGDGTSGTNRNTFTQVKGVNGTGNISGITHLASGNDFSMILNATTGLAYGFGRGDEYQLSTGDNTSTNSSPRNVKTGGSTTNLTNIANISCGEDFSYFLIDDGTVYASGEGSAGEQGDGANSDNTSASACTGLSNIVDILGTKTCGFARKSDGTLYVWGDNTHGQFANGSASTGDTHTPTEITSITGVEEISAYGRGEILIARKSDGSVWCWGEGTTGSIGNGFDSNASSPVQVLPGAGPSVDGKFNLFTSPRLSFDGHNKLSIYHGLKSLSSSLFLGSNTYNIGALTSDLTIETPGVYKSLTYDMLSGAAYFDKTTVSAIASTLKDFVLDNTLYGTVESGDTHGLSQGGFGTRCILNADGTRLLVTDPLNEPDGRGRAYIYHLESGSWALKETWDNPAGNNQRFADSACMNEDGTRVFLQFAADDHVYVYEYASGAWETSNSGTHTISPGTGMSSEKPCVACNKAGDVVIIGYGHGNKAYIYRRASATSWSQDSGGSFTKGRGVAINGAGTRAFVGHSDGTVHVTDWSGSSWSALSEIINESYSGWPNEIQSDSAGETLVIVTGQSSSNADESGIYERASDGSWSRTQGVVAHTEIYGIRNSSISYDGTMVLVGNNTYDSDKGRAQLWQKSGGSWSLTQEFLNPDASPAVDDYFGAGCGIAQTTKDKIVIGMLGDDTAGTDYGSVWTYTNAIPKYLDFDTYNKLSINDITPTSTSLRLGSNTYDIGTATSVYIKDAGTYSAEIKGATNFALSSNVVSQVKLPDVVTVDWNTTSLSSITASNGDTLTTNVGGTWDVQTDSTMGKMVHIQTATTSRKFEIENSTQSLTSFVGTGDGVTISFYMKSGNPAYGSPKWFNDLFRVTGSASATPNVYAQVTYDTGQTYSVTHAEWMYVQISYKWDGSNFVDYTFYIIDENGDQEVKVSKSNVTTNNGLQSSNKFWETNNKWFNMEVATFRSDINLDFYLTNFRFENKYRSEFYWKGVPPSTTGPGLPKLTFDTYNKLSINDITPISTSLRLGSNTYDIGTATSVYIKDAGTYSAEIKGATNFALVSNTTGNLGTYLTLHDNVAISHTTGGGDTTVTVNNIKGNMTYKIYFNKQWTDSHAAYKTRFGLKIKDSSDVVIRDMNQFADYLNSPRDGLLLYDGGGSFDEGAMTIADGFVTDGSAGSVTVEIDGGTYGSTSSPFTLADSFYVVLTMSTSDVITGKFFVGDTEVVTYFLTRRNGNTGTIGETGNKFEFRFFDTATISGVNMTVEEYNPAPKLTFDGYNKLTLSGLDSDATSNVTFDGNTYDIGTATNIYISEDGTYDAESKSANTFALMSNTATIGTNPYAAYANYRSIGGISAASTSLHNENITTTYSVTMWAKKIQGMYFFRTANSDSSTNPTNTHGILRWASSKIAHVTWTSNNSLGITYNTSLDATSKDEWHFYGFKFQGTSSELHLDGASPISGTTGLTGQTHDRIRFDSTTMFSDDGARLAEFAVYNRALTDAEFVSIYNNGLPNGPDNVSSGRVSWFKCLSGAMGTNSGSGGDFDCTFTEDTDVPDAWKDPNPSLTFDGYNKLSINNLTPTSSTLTDPNGSTYDIGTATNIYIENAGTYKTQTKGSTDFAFLSNVSSGTVKTVEPVITGAYGFGHALTYDGKLYGWGKNGQGQIGVGDSTDKTSPTLCTGIPQSEVASIWNQSKRGESRWAKTKDGRIWVTGRHDGYCLPGSSADFTTFTDVSAEFGDHTQTSNSVVWASGSERATQVLMENGDVWSFGDDGGAAGILGQGGSPTSDRTPRKVTGISNVTKIVYNGDLVLALDSSNVVWMWGSNDIGHGSLKNWGPYNVPTNIMGTGTANLTGLLVSGETVTDIECGSYSMFAITSKGTVYATGRNGSGQLGQGGTTEKSSSDGWVKIEYFTSNAITVNRLYTGQEHPHVFADTSDGWYCWGENGSGQLGLGDTTDKYSPVKWTGVSNIKVFGTVENGCYAITEDGKYYAWGSGGSNRRGDNATGAISFPKYIDALPNILAPSFEFDGYDKVFVMDKGRIGKITNVNATWELGGPAGGGGTFLVITGDYDTDVIMSYADIGSGWTQAVSFGGATNGRHFLGSDGHVYYDDGVGTIGYGENSRGEWVIGEWTYMVGDGSGNYIRVKINSLTNDDENYTKFTKNTVEYDAGKAPIITVSDTGTYDAQIRGELNFALKSETIPATKASGLYTWAFHHGTFDNAYGDGDILTARDNGRFYADTPAYTGDIGTISVKLVVSDTQNFASTITPTGTGDWVGLYAWNLDTSQNTSTARFYELNTGSVKDGFEIRFENGSTVLYCDTSNNEWDPGWVSTTSSTTPAKSKTLILGETVDLYRNYSTPSTKVGSFTVTSGHLFATATSNKSLTTYTFEPPSGGLTANVLMVAGGGGGGGRYHAGGGGAGGLVYTAGTSLAQDATKTIVVGNGDSGGNADSSGENGFNGKNTTFTDLTSAVGGGGGGANYTAANSGGSGGGGGASQTNGTNHAGGSGTADQGNDGGVGIYNAGTDRSGGGGGGAGGAGIAGVSGGVSGEGGIGKFFGTGSSFTNFGDEYGEGGWFAGGGGGGVYNSGSPQGIPGRGGGGYGADENGYMCQGGSQHALPHTGGGGGGSGTGELGGSQEVDQHPGYGTVGNGGVMGHGGRGGSGIVLIQTNVAPPNGANTAVVQVGNPRRRSLPPAVDRMGSEVNRFYIIDGASMPTYKLPTHWYIDPPSYNGNGVPHSQGSHSLQKRADGGTSNVWYQTSYTYFQDLGSKMAQTVDSVFMPVEQQRYDVLLSIGNNNDHDIQLEMAADGTARITRNDDADTLLQAGSIKCFTVGKWHHIALTVDSGGNAVGYVNGYPVVSATYTSNPDVGSRGGNNCLRVGVTGGTSTAPTFRKFLTYEVSTYNFHMSPKQVLQRAAEVGCGPKLEYDGLNTLKILNTEPGSTIRLFTSNVADTSNVFIVADPSDSEYTIPEAGKYYAEIKGTDTFTVTRTLDVSGTFPLYQYPPIDGTSGSITGATAADSFNNIWTISGAASGNGQYQVKCNRAADNNHYNAWRNNVGSTNQWQTPTNPTYPITFTILLPSAKTIRKYRMFPIDHNNPNGSGTSATPGTSVDPTLSGNSGDDATKRPKSWVIRGSNNDSDWTDSDLDTVTDKPISIDGDVYSIDSPASYQYYQVSITANNGGDKLLLGDIQLWGDA